MKKSIQMSLFDTATTPGDSLVEAQRREIGIAYKDSAFTWLALASPVLVFDGTTTDPTRSITLTADHGNRHYGIPGAGATIDNSGNNSSAAVFVLDDHVTIEWLEILSPVAPSMGIDVGGQLSADNLVTLRNLIVHDTASHGINLQWPGLSASVSNNFVFDAGGDGIRHDPTPGLQAGRYVHVLNNTVWNAGVNAVGVTMVELPGDRVGEGEQAIPVRLAPAGNQQGCRRILQVLLPIVERTAAHKLEVHKAVSASPIETSGYRPPSHMVMCGKKITSSSTKRQLPRTVTISRPIAAKLLPEPRCAAGTGSR